MNNCWNDGIPFDATEIIIPDNSCNEVDDGLDLSPYYQLKSLVVGNNCFSKLAVVEFHGLSTLVNVTIGQSSFMGGAVGSQSGLSIKNCDRLRELRIGRYSFQYYRTCEIESVDSLELIEMGDFKAESKNFYYSNLELKSERMRRIIIRRLAQIEEPFFR